MKKLFGLILGCLGSLPLHAAESSPVIHLYSIDYPPFIIGVDVPPRQGIALEAIQQALAHAGLRGQWVDLPWKRAQMQAQSETYGCLAPLTRSASREAQYRWVGLLDGSSQSLYVLASKPADIRTLADLKGKRVVALLGSSMAEWLHQHDVAFAELPTTEDAYRELSMGVADAWAVHSLVARYLVKKQGRRAEPIQEALRLQETRIYLACGKRMPEEVAQRLSNAFRWLRESGEMERIIARYVE
ncbi:substrate-binding periplasmic protein [Chromobacterium amazonense]|uniref:substrate-binding periplasmic protein n=1 Tax=Chromobacterium amazonense TaxID=1382803 RepID=UPI0031F6BCC2